MKKRPEDTIELGEKDVFEYYLEKKEATVTVHSIREYTSGLRKFQAFLERTGYSVDKMGLDESMEFMQWLKSRDELKEKTAERYARIVSNMVTWYVEKGYFEWNPVQRAWEQTKFKTTVSARRPEIPLSELRQALNSTSSDTLFVALVMMLKLGTRKSETINLDERDINIDHPISNFKDDPRPEIMDQPDTVFIPSNIREYQDYNGEYRTRGNKRSRDTYIPLDDELKRTLIWWFGTAPKSQSPGRAIIRGASGATMGLRWSYSRLGSAFADWAREHGFRIEDADPSNNVTPHWTRHFFTTHLKNRVTLEDLNEQTQPRYYVKSLRGDSGSDVIDVYLHEWGENDWKRQAYLDKIPKLLIDD